MVSYWTKVDNIFESDSFVVIHGNYNHKNADPSATQALRLFCRPLVRRAKLDTSDRVSINFKS